LYEISVKAIGGGGKWPVGKDDLSLQPDRIFVLLPYRNFEDLNTNPEAFVMPALTVEALKRDWFSQYAVYLTNQEWRQKLEPYRDAWDQYIV
jgi:hypothetical protein